MTTNRDIIPDQLQGQIQTERDRQWVSNAILFTKEWPLLATYLTAPVHLFLVYLPTTIREKGPRAKYDAYFSSSDRKLAGEMRAKGILDETNDNYEDVLQAKFAVALGSCSLFASKSWGRIENAYTKATENCCKKRTASK